MPDHRRLTVRAGAAVLLFAATAPLLVVGCGDDPPELSAAAAEGRSIAQARGCAACHAGLDSDSTIGPSWLGAWGSMVMLADGTEVQVDEEYVRIAVRAPDTQRREGDWLRMPTFSPDQLTDVQLDSIIAYLRELEDA